MTRGEGAPAFQDFGFARVDHDRARRRGHPETIYCPGKTPEQVVAIAERLIAGGAENVLATRAPDEILQTVARRIPGAHIHPEARLCVLNPVRRPSVGLLAVVACRPEDRPVAQEAALTAEAMGSRVVRDFRAPFARPADLPAWFESLQGPNVIVAVEGRGGALASVVAGLGASILIAVPTSAGSRMGGMPALFANLSSCVPGVLTVNIDNGFGAGYAAHVINAAMARTSGGRVKLPLRAVPDGGRSG